MRITNRTKAVIATLALAAIHVSPDVYYGWIGGHKSSLCPPDSTMENEPGTSLSCLIHDEEGNPVYVTRAAAREYRLSQAKIDALETGHHEATAEEYARTR